MNIEVIMKTVTPREARDFRKASGVSLSNAGESAQEELLAWLYSIAKTREDEKVSFDEALDVPLDTINEFFGLNE